MKQMVKKKRQKKNKWSKKINKKRRIAESFLINKRAKVVNVLNRNDGLVLPSIYSMLLD